jgi:hypothetical protein
MIQKFPAEFLQNWRHKHSSVCFLMSSLMLMQQQGELNSTENALQISFSAKLEVRIIFHRC